MIQKDLESMRETIISTLDHHAPLTRIVYVTDVQYKGINEQSRPSGEV